MKPKEMAGLKFGRLLVVSLVGTDRKRNAVWECLCDCGNRTKVAGWSLRNGDTKSCGCLRTDELVERSRVENKTHGKSHSREYYSWKSMIQRCTNPKHGAYPRYGGRGITICERWVGDGGFAAFIADKGNRPPGTTLDRFPDNDGNYSPENTRWATPAEQANNRRDKK